MNGPQGLPVFDARQVEPKQGIPQHPIGKFPAIITETALKPNGDGQNGGHFEVMFKTPAGMIAKRYNLYYTGDNAEITVRIAQQELFALCWATGVFQVNPATQGAELRNAQLQIEVAPQRKKPEYMEVVRVYDVNGNEPGKGGGVAPQPQPSLHPQPQPQQFQPPQQPQPPAGWSPNAPPQQTQQPNPQGAWGPAPQQAQPQSQNPATPWTQGGGQQGGGQQGGAPWGNRS